MYCSEEALSFTVHNDKNRNDQVKLTFHADTLV